MNGSPSSEQKLECAEHAATAAVGRCVVCGKPICGECSVQSGSHFICKATDHQVIAESWIVIHRSTSEFESDIISKNLSSQGVESKVFSTRAFKLRLGEDPEDSVSVFVPRENLERARQVLRLLDLGDEQQQADNS